MIIRPATIWDAEQVATLWYDMYREIAVHSALREEYSNKESFFLNAVTRAKLPEWCLLVAEDKPDIIGFLMGQATYPRYNACRVLGCVEALYVMPQFRGQGVFTQLIGKAFEWAKTKNITEIEFLSMANSRVSKLYDRLGYEPVMVIYRKKEA